jgi:endonuclease/exonuclease/phosphatase family protein
VRIGTWNLEGRWSAAHRQLLDEEDCDAWLLTEVPGALSLARGSVSWSRPMDATKAFAAVWSREPAVAAPPPHPASATAVHDRVLLCSSVLPWRSARTSWPDRADDLAGVMSATLSRLHAGLTGSAAPVVWGGDWNQTLTGPCAGTLQGRRLTQELVDDLGLQVPTRDLPHATAGLSSIDHIAVPTDWRVSGRRRVVATRGGSRLSDHDAYVVDCAPDSG